jgi:pyrophosphatase PpaX
LHLKAVLFDLDGTLVSYNLRLLEAKKEAISYLRRLGIARENEDENSLSTQKMLDIIKERSPSSYKQVRKRVFKIFEKYELEACSKIRLMPGALYLLQTLNMNGIFTGIVTNNSLKAAKLSLQKAGIAKLICILISRDDVDKLKPEPDGILEAIKRLRILKSEAIYVGDAPVDIVAAKKAGVKACALTCGAHSKERLILENPDYTFNSLHDILSLVVR